VFTINKRESNIVKIRKRKTKEDISTMEISKRFLLCFVLLFCSIGLEKDVIYRRRCFQILSFLK